MNEGGHSGTEKHGLAVAVICGALPGVYLLLTSTTTLVSGAYAYDVKRLLEVALLGGLFIVALVSPPLRRGFAEQCARIPIWIRYALLLIVALGLVSALLNARSVLHAAYSLLDVALPSLLIMAALVIGACRQLAGKMFDEVVITLLAVTATAIGFQELVGVAAALSSGVEFHYHLSLAHFSHPRFYNQVQSWMLPVLAALPVIWSQSRSELLRSRGFQATVCLLALGLNWYIVMMTGGRGVTISLITAFLLALLFLPPARMLLLKWQLGGVILGLAIFATVVQVSDAVLSDSRAAVSAPTTLAEESTADPVERAAKEEPGAGRLTELSLAGRLSLDSSGRWWLWRDAVQHLRDHPVIGIGPMNYACAGPRRRAAHPHSFPLQFAAEWGAFAFALLAVVVSALAVALWKRARAQYGSGAETRLVGLLAVSLFAAGLYSFLSGVIVMPASQIAGALVGGWFLGITAKTITRAERTRPGRVTGTLIVALIVAVGVCAFSSSEFSKRSQYEQNVQELEAGIPRYWQIGKICRHL